MSDVARHGVWAFPEENKILPFLTICILQKEKERNVKTPRNGVSVCNIFIVFIKLCVCVCVCVFTLLNCTQPRNPASHSMPFTLILPRGDQ